MSNFPLLSYQEPKETTWNSESSLQLMVFFAIVGQIKPSQTTKFWIMKVFIIKMFPNVKLNLYSNIDFLIGGSREPPWRSNKIELWWPEGGQRWCHHPWWTASPANLVNTASPGMATTPPVSSNLKWPKGFHPPAPEPQTVEVFSVFASVVPNFLWSVFFF